MKETKAAITALRQKAATYLQLAKALEHMDRVTESFNPNRRRLSKAARARISAAQKARWAKVRRAKKAS